MKFLSHTRYYHYFETTNVIKGLIERVLCRGLGERKEKGLWEIGDRVTRDHKIPWIIDLLKHPRKVEV